MSNNVVDAEQWFQKGKDYVNLQNYDDAIKSFNKAIEIYRNHLLGSIKAMH
jgi:tetratricopeptide (TPR) repeat protein